MTEKSSQVGVQIRADGPCGTIVIKSSQRRNAISRLMFEQLQQAFDDMHQERSVRAILLTGDGQTFCAGSDLHEIAEAMDADDAERVWFADANHQRMLLASMLRFPKPIIAAVNGAALGFGMALMAACDMVIAAPEAIFGFPEARCGLTAGAAAPLIAFRVGAGHAAHLLLRGHTIDSVEAQRIGLIHEVVPFELLWARGRELANEFARVSPVAVAITKRVLNEGFGENMLSQLTSAAAAMASARTTEHAAKGVRAFVDKLDPDWS